MRLFSAFPALTWAAIIISLGSIVYAANINGKEKLAPGVAPLKRPYSRSLEARAPLTSEKRVENINADIQGLQDLQKREHHKSRKAEINRPAALEGSYGKSKHGDKRASGVVKGGTSEPSAGCTECSSSLKFAKAGKYEVGNQIPSVPFKTKTSWAGDIPIDKKGNEDRALYFWLWGKDGKDDKDTDVVIWLNGGPGCSSLSGMLEELGPFLFAPDSSKLQPNPYSWTRAAHMLFIEQPVGVGFTIGKEATLNDEKDVASDFDSFLRNFFDIFSELKGRNVYIAGESYAGSYIPYIVSYQYKNGNKFNIKGTMIGDGTFTADALQQDLVAYDVGLRMKDILKFDQYDVEPLRLRATKCKYVDYLKEHLTYPPKGPLPSINPNGCFAFYSLYYYAKGSIPNFNVYNVKKPKNQSADPLGPLQYDRFDPQKTFFDNPELQKYIHAPAKKWNVCQDVFKHEGGQQLDKSDKTLDDGALKAMIEGNKRTTLLSGGLDLLLPYEGIQLVVQNMTWAGKQGFSSPPNKPFADMEGNTQQASFTSERGLTLIYVPEAGHMIPADQPSVGLKALYDLLDKKPDAA